MRYLLGLGLFFGFASAVAAQGAGGPYFGVGMGKTRYDGTGEGGGALSGDTYSYRLLGGYRFGNRYSVEAGWGLMPEVGEKLEIFAVHGIAALSFSRIGLYGGVGYYEASFDKGMPLQSDDFEISGIGTPDLSGVSDHEHRDDRGLTVIGGLRLDLGRGSLRAEYEWLDTNSGFDTAGVNLLLLIRF